MDKHSPTKSTNSYGKHSKTFWVLVYILGAVVVYGLIYLLFIRKSGSGGLNY